VIAGCPPGSNPNASGDISIYTPPATYGTNILMGCMCDFSTDYVFGDSANVLAYDTTYTVLVCTWSSDGVRNEQTYSVHTPKEDGTGGWVVDGSGAIPVDDPITPIDPPGPIVINPPSGSSNPDPARNVDAGGCYDGRRRGWQLRAYSLIDGAWKRKAFTFRAVKEARFVHRREGGMSQLDASLALPIGTPAPLYAGDRLSVWVREQLGWVEWWRGYVQISEHSTDRPDTLSVTAYGAMERFRGIYVSRQYAAAAQDLSDLFSQVLIDYANPWYAEQGIPAPIPDVQKIGITVGETRQLEGSLLDVLTGLVRGIPGVTWGVDIDEQGRERIYLRPRPTDAEYVVAYGHDVSTVQFGEDASEIVNALVIEGGTPLFPNLIANGSFEKPVNEGANLILNPSFEDVQADDPKTARHWARISGDPAAIGPDNGASDKGLSPASGSRYMEFDNRKTGREEIQGDPVAVKPSGRYTLRMAMAAQTSGVNIRPIVRVKMWRADASYIGYVDAGASFTGPVNDQVWGTFDAGFTVDPQARTAAVVIGLPDGVGGKNRGIGVDDVQLFSADELSQESWHAQTNDTTEGLPTSVATVKWAEKDAALGAYCVCAGWTTGNHTACYAGIEADPIAAGINQELRLSFYARAVYGTHVHVLVRQYDGKDWKTAVPVAGDGAAELGGRKLTLTAEWQRFHVDVKTASDCQQVTVLFGGLGASVAGQAEMDGVYLHAGWPTNEDGTVAIYPYIEGSAVVTYRYSTEDAWFQDPADPVGQYATQDARNSALWHTGAKAGQVHYGRREVRVSAPKVRTQADAMKWAVNYFNLNGTAKAPSPLTVSDRIRNIRAIGLMRLVNLPDGRDGLTLFPVQATHTFSRAGWKCEVERAEERGDLAALISQIGQTANDRYTTVLLAADGSASSASKILSAVTSAPASTAWVWASQMAGAGATTIVIDTTEKPVASGSPIIASVSGGAWDRELIEVAGDGKSITLSAPAGYPFTASDKAGVYYQGA
jgi:hypothetical protein